LVEILAALSQELINLIFRHIFFNDYSPQLVWKLGLLRASKEDNIVAALRDSLDMYAMVRVGCQNPERELLSKNWGTVWRLEHHTVTVPALGRGVAKPDDIKTEFETLFAKLLPNTLHSLLF
jgi:hypothetical protein